MLANGNNGRYPAGRPAAWAGVPGVVGARVVAGAEPGDPAEAAALVPAAGVLAVGAEVAVLPQPEITRLTNAATVNRAVLRKW
jgi:hypothetical protein